ncbi:MAG TPA: 30S ribosomal protein S12 methylthiotransferase RimO [Candidatus Limnocylindrales bacterium]|nr:30S ribosomal protein S12 methylthiotransferase RimO [Candidatus Limnocylindrales bacterium]
MSKKPQIQDPTASRKIFLARLGCPKNQVDGELMIGRALAQGHELVDSPDQADVLVVNTCAFIQEARQESVDTILELARIKARQEGRRLVVTGCMAERYGAELTASIPEIDAMVGTGALDSFPAAIDSTGGVIFRGDKHYLPAAWMERRVTETDGSAYLKVSEGCDHECSFCVIPSFRGRHESRTIDDVAAEAERLAGAGIVELNLIAQDLSAYGRDRGLKDGLAQLLWRLGRVAGLERVRCFYLYPSTLTDSALDAIANVGNVVPYIDIPLQHADGEILRRMRRHRDTGQVRRILERIRERVPGAAIRTSFIVGFPGETEEAFGRLCDFVTESRFHRIGVFTYSPEEGSAAFDLPDPVDAQVAEYRRDALLALQEPISAGWLADEVGQRRRVLVCGRDEDGQWYGRTDLQAPEIDGVTFLTEQVAEQRGRLIDVEITGSDGFDLFGNVSPAD